MSSPPPTKPPRGVKQGKETSGLLMSVIRTLSASETNEQREKERAKLEKEYKKSDAKLDELVAQHAPEIMEVMQKFTDVNTALTVWGQHCDAAVARMGACRSLLRLRRDDLRRLWADARTHHYALNMLTDIERAVVSEREAREASACGRVLCAAWSTRAALQTCRSLPHVHALHHTLAHLQVKKGELVEAIVRRLSECVYRGPPPARRVSARRRTALLLAELMKTEEVTDAYLQDITPEFEASLSEEDKTFETTAMISLEALGVLEQLTEATEKFKVQIQNELLAVIDTVSRRIIDEGEAEPDVEGEQDGEMHMDESVTETGRPLMRLVESLAEEFKDCGARNKRLVQLWRAALQKHQLSDSSLHTEHHYWSAVQQVLQLLLTEYLDIESVNLAAARGTSAATAVVGVPVGVDPTSELRLSDYFGKKKPQRRRPKLFKLTVGTDQSGVGSTTVRRHGMRLVTRPDPVHLHAVLPTLHTLLHHIENSTGGGECSLRAFISDYVRSGETERLARAAKEHVDAALRAPTAWRERTRAPSDTGDRVIFSCVRNAWSGVRSVCVRARACGWCGGSSAARAVLAAVNAASTACRAAHTRMQPTLPTRTVRAARWLADDDIVRFLQALPNWRAITATTLTARERTDLKQAYEREAEILGSSLGDGAVHRREIVDDINVLSDLAVLCESMDWLSGNIKTIPSIITAPLNNGVSPVKLSERFMNEISSAAKIFEEMSHKCLLFLHLEMRIQCFHYLGQEGASGSEGGAGGVGASGVSVEESGAAALSAALLSLHEQTSAVLQPAHLWYVCRGVGEMMSAAVVWRWQTAGSGGVGGDGAAGALTTLRHCLAALQLPHDGLHRAHTYLHLLTCSQEEIINNIKERGPQFSELEYLNAFKVIGTRQGLANEELRAYLQQLSVALGHLGVTV